jgi:polyisoprenoid-binding protein YceI
MADVCTRSFRLNREEKQMNYRTLLKFVAFLVVTSCAVRGSAAPENYTIDAAHTSIVFSVGHSGLSYTYGFFRRASGSYVLDEANPGNSQFQLVIEADSLDTNHAKRDEHLRGPDFFNVQQFPTITFQSTGCTFSNTPERGPEYLVTGNLKLHGIERQVKLPLRMLAKGLGPYKDQRTGFLCQYDLKRSDYGMTELLKDNLVGDAVSITISFEGYVPNSAQPRR